MAIGRNKQLFPIPMLVAALGLVATAPVDAAIVSVYGASGSFGTLGTMLPSGQSVSTVAIPGWQLDPGQAAFFPTVTSDGTVFLANMTQTFQELFASACSSVVTCFNPSTPACFDAAAGTGKLFANLRIPTGTGNLFLPPGMCSAVPPFGAQGAAIDDVERVVDPTLGERVVFSSGFASLGKTTDDAFPTFGSLRKTGSTWSVDAAASRSPVRLALSNPPVSQLACPSSAATCCSDAECSGGTCEGQACMYTVPGHCNIPCTTNASCGPGQTCMANGRCGVAGCGFTSEIGRTPVSNRIVIGQYGASGFFVVDAAGTVLASYSVGPVPKPCGLSGNLGLPPREIDTDPTSVLGDERFVASFDSANDPRGQAIQEYSYDDTHHTIRAVSAAFFASSAQHVAANCSGPAQVQDAQYDHQGNLWVSRNPNGFVSQLDVYLKDPITGKRRVETACNVIDPSTGQPRPWGMACTADLETGNRDTSSGDFSVPTPVHILEDTGTGTMFTLPIFTGASSGVVAIERSASVDGTPFTVRDRIDTALRLLRQPGTGAGMGHTKGVVDPVRRALWAPITESEVVTPNRPDCTNCFLCGCQWGMGIVRDTWFYRFDIDQLLAFGARVSDIVAPRVIGQNQSFKVILKTSLTAGVDSANSALAVYLNGAATPTSSVSWGRSCSGATCTFTGTVPASATSGSNGSLVWHGYLRSNGGQSLHSSGHLDVLGAKTITTLAGSGTLGFAGDGGAAVTARIDAFRAVADSAGNLYIADTTNHRIRKVTTGGIITTIAGTGTFGFGGDGGPATAASLASPTGVALDDSGNLYVADFFNGRIRKISSAGIITTFAGGGSSLGDGGPATKARLVNPSSLVIEGNNFYIADAGNHRVRRINSSGTISTVAGTGVAGFAGDGGAAAAAQLNTPTAVVRGAGGVMYIADPGNQRVRFVDGNNRISTFAGMGVAGFSGDGGPATAAKLSSPADVAVNGSQVYIAEELNNRVRRVDANGTITTFAGGGAATPGNGGLATAAKLVDCSGVSIDGLGNVLVTERGAGRVRLVVP